MANFEIEQLRKLNPAWNPYSDEQIAQATGLPLENANAMSQGWESAGLAERSNDLLWQATQAQRAGDATTAAKLAGEAEALSLNARRIAPRVQEASEIRGLRDGFNWLGGAVGSGARSSMKPMAAGLAGAAAGALSPIPGGALIGGTLGAFGAGYDVASEATLANYLNDPELRDKSLDEKVNRARIAAVPEAALDTVGTVVSGVGGKVLRKGVTSIADDVAKKGVGRYVAGRTAESILGEGATGGAQNISGQLIRNDFAGTPNKDIDWKAAANDAAAEAAGGVVGAGTGAVQGVMGKFMPTTRGAGDTALPPAAAQGASAGEAFAALERKLSAPTPSQADEWMLNTPLDGKLPDEQLLSHADNRAQAAQRVAQTHVDRADNTPEMHASAKFLSALNSASEGERDTLVEQYKSDLSRAGSTREFTDAVEEFKTLTSGKNSEQGIPDHKDASNGPLSQVREVWMKHNAKLSDVFGDLNVDDAEVRNGASALFDWVLDGMPNFDKVAPAVSRMWGKNATTMVKSAHDYAVAEGLLPAQDVGQQLSLLTTVANNGSSRLTKLGQLLRPTLQDALTTRDVRMLDKELTAYARGKDVGADFKGKLGRFFGGHTDDVIALYEPAAQETLELGNAPVDEGRDENGDSVESSDWTGNIQEEQGQTIYHGMGNGPFDTIYDRAKQALQEKKGSLPGAFEVGIWTKLKREFADNPEALRGQEDELIRKYGDHLSVKVYSSRDAKLAAINRRVRLLGENVRQEKEAIDIDEKELTSLAMDGGTYGQLVFEREVEDKSKQSVNEDGEWQTSAAKLIERMRKARKEGGFEDEKEGTLNAAQQLSDVASGIASLLQMPSFKRVGVRGANGKVQWLSKGSLPDTLQVWGDGTTVGKLKQAVSDARMGENRQIVSDFVERGAGSPDLLSEAVNVLKNASKNPQALERLVAKIQPGREEAREGMWSPSPTTTMDKSTLRKRTTRNHETGNEVVTLTPVRESVGEAGVSETDEMARNARGEDPVISRDLEHSLDRDEVGQVIPARDIQPVLGDKQRAYITKLLDKGVPAFVNTVKAMTEQQRFAIRAALREMVKTGKLEGSMLTKAKNVLKALRGVKEKVGAGDTAVATEEVKEVVKMPSEDIKVVLGNDADLIASVQLAFDSPSRPRTVERNTVNSLRTGQSKYDFLSFSNHSNEQVRKVLSGVRDWLGSVNPLFGSVQLAVFLDGPKNVAMNYIAKYDLIGIKSDVLESLLGKSTFTERLEVLRSLVHEGAHSLDVQHVDGDNAYRSTRNEGWVIGKGVYFKEMQGLFANGLGKTILKYPFDNYLAGAMKDDVFVGELFAQGYALHILTPEYFQQFAPTTHNYFQQVHNAKSKDEATSIVASLSLDGNSENLQRSQSGTKANATVGPREVRDTGRPEDGPEPVGGASSNQSQNQTPLTDEEKQAILDELATTLGPKLKVQFEDLVGASGKHHAGLIRLAHNAAFGVHRHEALHEFFRILKEAGSAETVKLLENVATNKLINRQLRHLLQDSPKALKQLGNPEESAAYLHQFWKAGLITLGPKSDTFFQKVTNLIKSVLKLTSESVRDMEHAETILRALSEGKFASEPSVAAQAVEKALARQRAEYANVFWRKLGNADFMRKAVFTAGDVLRDTKNPALIKLADKLYTPATGKMGEQSYFDALPQQRAVWLNKLDKLMVDQDPEDIKLALKHLQGESDLKNIHDPVIRKLVGDVRKHLDDMYEQYIVPSGMQHWDEENKAWKPVPKIKAKYFPRVWDTTALVDDKDGFVQKLMELHEDDLKKIGGKLATPEQVALEIHRRLVEGNGVPDITEDRSSLGITPFAQAVNKRSLNWIDAAAFEPYMSKDVASILTNYTVQMIKRGEYQKRFGPDGAKIQESLDEALLHDAFGKDQQKAQQARDTLREQLKEHRSKKTDDAAPTMTSVLIKMIGEKQTLALREKLNLPIQAIMAAEGTLGREISDNMRSAFGYVTIYQNMRTLSLALFSSLVDPMGIIVRGGTLNDAYEGFVRGIKEVVKGWKGELSNDEMSKLAERLGTVDASSFMDALGQTYSSMYMSGKLKTWNDKLFKWNGMEAWNRAMRIQATGAAIGFIERHLTKPTEHSERYLKDELGLTGDGYLKDGSLDVDNPQVQQAIVRWVNGAILRPNAMQRPIIASDPHYELVYHLKQFTYSFHKTILARVANEAQHGNMSPAMALMVGYVPMMIAADVIKELLRPGEEPPWMKQGLGAYVEHGVMRSNLLGIPQIGLEALPTWGNAERTGSDAARLFGPAAEQTMEWLEVPLSEKKTFGQEFVQSLPFQPLYSKALAG